MPLDIPDDLQKAAAAKSINDQINQYIVVMDTKASAFLAGDVAVASFYLSTMPESDAGRMAYYLALALFGAAILVAGGVIFPRLPQSGNSIVFWGDIAASADFKSYQERFQRALNDGFLDEQYCVQNYLAARVLRKKFLWLRCSILLSLAALFVAFFAYLKAH